MTLPSRPPGLNITRTAVLSEQASGLCSCFGIQACAYLPAGTPACYLDFNIRARVGEGCASREDRRADVTRHNVRFCNEVPDTGSSGNDVKDELLVM